MWDKFKDKAVRLFYLGMLIVNIIVLVLVILHLIGCSEPVEITQERKWVVAQDKRCLAAKGRGSYNKDTKIYECWGKPSFRRAKVIFEEKYL